MNVTKHIDAFVLPNARELGKRFLWSVGAGFTCSVFSRTSAEKWIPIFLISEIARTVLFFVLNENKRDVLIDEKCLESPAEYKLYRNLSIGTSFFEIFMFWKLGLISAIGISVLFGISAFSAWGYHHKARNLETGNFHKKTAPEGG